MKESTLIKMKSDIQKLQQVVVVALHKIEKLEAKDVEVIEPEKVDIKVNYDYIKHLDG